LDTSKDYYAILGVLPTAEDIVVRAAYRALAQRFHPDRHPGAKDEATARIAEINEAYRILSSPPLRQQYDAARSYLAGQNAASSSTFPTSFEAEQFRAFAEKLHCWGYDETSICQALEARGVRPAVARQLALAVSGHRE
jgi:curved DNA-binding protein CbpA